MAHPVPSNRRRPVWGIHALVASALAIALIAHPAAAHDYVLGDLQIIHPSIPATPLDATSAPVHMVLSNDGPEAERLLGIETPFGPVAFQRPVVQPDGSVRMEEIAWIDIPAGDIVVLAPGDRRGVLAQLGRPLVEGGELEGTMLFAKRGRFSMVFMIDPPDTGVAAEPSRSDAVSPSGDRAAEITAVASALRAELGSADAMIAPVVAVGTVAIAGWSVGDESALAVLKRYPDRGWTVVLWSNDSVLLPATLTGLGVAPTDAEALRTETTALRHALGPAYDRRFAAFPGTVHVGPPGE